MARQILGEAAPHSVYVLPYAGGAATLFAKPVIKTSNTTHYREVINDHNNLLVTFYRTGKSDRDELIKLIKGTPYSRSEYRRAHEICTRPMGHSSLDIAWATYVNFAMSFSNSLDGGWRTSTLSTNCAATWCNKKRRLESQLDRLENVHIEDNDALDCIKTWDSPQTLFYTDPPYPGAAQRHYSGFTLKDWGDLCDVLDSIQGSYIVSNYAQEKEPKSAQKRIEVETVTSSARAGTLDAKKRTEILWVCDRSSHARKSLQPIMRRNYQQLSLVLASPDFQPTPRGLAI